MTGTVTISLSEWQTQLDARAAAEAEVARLKAALAAAEAADPSGRVPALLEGLRAARWLAGLAMQYPAKRWPIDELRIFARAFSMMPGATVDEGVVAIDMLKFCDEMVMKEAITLTAPVAGPNLDPNLDHSSTENA